jgi:hypothetical protein
MDATLLIGVCVFVVAVVILAVAFIVIR